MQVFGHVQVQISERVESVNRWDAAHCCCETNRIHGRMPTSKEDEEPSHEATRCIRALY